MSNVDKASEEIPWYKIHDLIFSSGLTTDERIVLWLIYRWTLGVKPCWHSVPTIAKAADISVRKCQGVLQVLHEEDLIKVETRTGKSTYHTFNLDNVHSIRKTSKKNPRKPRTPASPADHTPAEDAPPQDLHHTPASPADLPPHSLRTNVTKGMCERNVGNNIPPIVPLEGDPNILPEEGPDGRGMPSPNQAPFSEEEIERAKGHTHSSPPTVSDSEKTKGPPHSHRSALAEPDGDRTPPSASRSNFEGTPEQYHVREIALACWETLCRYHPNLTEADRKEAFRPIMQAHKFLGPCDNTAEYEQRKQDFILLIEAVNESEFRIFAREMRRVGWTQGTYMADSMRLIFRTDYLLERIRKAKEWDKYRKEQLKQEEERRAAQQQWLEDIEEAAPKAEEEDVETHELDPMPPPEAAIKTPSEGQIWDRLCKHVSVNHGSDLAKGDWLKLRCLSVAIFDSRVQVIPTDRELFNELFDSKKGEKYNAFVAEACSSMGYQWGGTGPSEDRVVSYSTQTNFQPKEISA